MIAHESCSNLTKIVRNHRCSTFRKFITKEYSAIKAANPKLPILIREASNVPPVLIARFGTFMRFEVQFVCETVRGTHRSVVSERRADLTEHSYALS